jgi:hypothetical protein
VLLHLEVYTGGFEDLQKVLVIELAEVRVFQVGEMFGVTAFGNRVPRIVDSD